MSGGAFNYLYSKFELPNDEMESLLGYLVHRGHSDKAQAIVDVYHDITKKLERLQPLLKAVEWWASADWSEEQFLEEYQKWAANQQTIDIVIKGTLKNVDTEGLNINA